MGSILIIICRFEVRLINGEDVGQFFQNLSKLKRLKYRGREKDTNKMALLGFWGVDK